MAEGSSSGYSGGNVYPQQQQQQGVVYQQGYSGGAYPQQGGVYYQSGGFPMQQGVQGSTSFTGVTYPQGYVYQQLPDSSQGYPSQSFVPQQQMNVNQGNPSGYSGGNVYPQQQQQMIIIPQQQMNVNQGSPSGYSGSNGYPQQQQQQQQSSTGLSSPPPIQSRASLPPQQISGLTPPVQPRVIPVQQQQTSVTSTTTTMTWGGASPTPKQSKGKEKDDGSGTLGRGQSSIHRGKAWKVRCSGKRLARLDRTSLGRLGGSSDPYFVIGTPQCPVIRQKRFHRSEVVKSNVDPQFNEFIINFDDWETMDSEVLIEVWDWDRNSVDDLIGWSVTTLRQFLNPGFSCALMTDVTQNGSLASTSLIHCRGTFCVDAVTPCQAVIPQPLPPAFKMKITANSLARKDVLSASSDPYLQIRVQRQTKSTPGWFTMYRTEVKHKDLNPNWDEFTIWTDDIGSRYTLLEINVFDEDKANNQDDLIGRVENYTTLDELLRTPHIELQTPNRGKILRVLLKNAGELNFHFSPLNATKPPIPDALHLEITGHSLPIKDKLTLSCDPFLEMWGRPQGYYKGIYATQLVKLYRTEFHSKEKNPTWTFDVRLDSIGGLDGVIYLKIWDRDKRDAHDFIGHTKYELTPRLLLAGTMAESKLVNEGRGISESFIGKRIFHNGYVTIKMTPIQNQAPPQWPTGYTLQFKADSLERKDLGGLARSDPFFLIQGFATYDKGRQGKRLVVYQSEFVNGARDPTWKPFFVSSAIGMYSPLVVSVWDWDKNGKHEMIGEISTNLWELSHQKNWPNYTLFNPNKQYGTLIKNSGWLSVVSCTASSEILGVEVYEPEKEWTPEKFYSA